MNYFDDEDDSELIEAFSVMLDAEGVASIVVDDGVVVGFTVDKLHELLQLAAENKDKRIVVHIVSPTEDDDGEEPKLLN